MWDGRGLATAPGPGPGEPQQVSHPNPPTHRSNSSTVSNTNIFKSQSMRNAVYFSAVGYLLPLPLPLPAQLAPQAHPALPSLFTSHLTPVPVRLNVASQAAERRAQPHARRHGRRTPHRHLPRRRSLQSGDTTQSSVSSHLTPTSLPPASFPEPAQGCNSRGEVEGQDKGER